MKFTLLGSGTSQGVPVLGCSCPACLSSDPRDKRFRCSALVSDGKTNVVIDVGPDFRAQMLKHKVDRVDAVVLTHEHNDHIIGLDDLRPYIFRNKAHMKIYGEKRVLDDIKDRFRYAFEPHEYPGIPRFELVEIVPGDQIRVGDITLEALRIMHGQLPILAYKINTLAYLTDTSSIPSETKEKLHGVEYLVLDALREKKHHSHFNLEEAIDVSRELKAQTTYFIHVSHLLGPTSEWEKKIPAGTLPSFDGLELDV